MKLLWTTIHVTNMERSLQFYENILELKVLRRFSPKQGLDIAFLDCEAGQLELIQADSQNSCSYDKKVSLGLQIDSASHWLKKLTSAGIKTSGEIVSPSPGVKFFFASDPDGFQVELVELG